MRVLLLAGTAEARELAALLAAEPGVEPTASLAGHTADPRAYPCAVRTGGFGGAEGLADHLVAARVDALVDASHPFSRVLPGNAVEAAQRAGVPHLRLLRPPWEPGAGDDWEEVADLAAAARAVAERRPAVVLLTVGRLGLAAFDGVGGATQLLVRTVEPPEPRVLPGAEVLRGRGPFTVADELALLRGRGVKLLVTKNSGGDDAKLVAARQLGIPVVVVRRPPPVPAPTVATPTDALGWLRSLSA